MRTTARLLVPAVAALLLLPACPTLTLNGVALKDGSVSPAGFTLTATVVVEELEATEGEGSTPAEGRGLLALLLPAGWQVTDARMSGPLEGSVRRLTPVPQAALAFGETFPEEPGQWWAFGSNTQSIPQGRHEFSIELAVSVPKKTKSGTVGLSASVWNDSMDQLPAPAKYEVTLQGRKGKLTPVAAAPAFPAPEQPEDKGGNDKGSAG